MISSVSAKVWQGLCALFFICALTFGGLYLKEQSNAARARTALATEKKERSDDVALAAKVAASAVETARADERRMGSIREKAIRDEQERAINDAVDLQRQLSAEQRLRHRTQALAASCGAAGEDPAAAAGSPAAAEAGRVLADVQGQLVARIGALVEFSDTLYGRLSTCNAIADSHVTQSNQVKE